MTDNQVLHQLPQCYRQRSESWEIADALTRAIAELFAEYSDLLANYERDYLNPDTCLESWLDTLAFWVGWGDYWDSTWSVPVKRKLIKDADYIWSNRGNREIMPYLFSVFGLDATLASSTGFILGRTTLPGVFGGGPFSYVIKVNANYTIGTNERSLIDKLVRLFLPCWCAYEVIS